jgi:hypothetical protein
MTEEEEVSTEPLKTHWAIALDWFQQNNRSISALIRDYLCPKCAKKLTADKKESSPDVLMSTIQDCCSHTPGFINDRLPIIESVFRLFLANGNQSLDMEELGMKLSELRGGDPYRTSPEALLRLLKSDRYYGLQEVPEQSHPANA